MRILIILSNDNPEVKWNAVRFGNMLLNEDEEVTIFLNGPAANLFQGNSDAFPIREQTKIFTLSGGSLQA